MTQIRLKLLGGAYVEANGTPMAGRGVQRRRVALLALLASAKGAPVSRDRIIGVLWPDSGAQQARHLLSVALHEMRRLLGEEVLIASSDDVALNKAVVWCDVHEFEGALAARDLPAAISLYEGAFLEGFHLSDAPEFERWLDAERERLTRAYRGALEQRAVHLTNDGDTAGAAELWQKLAAEDPYNGRVAVQLMRALAAAGDRAAAIRHARIHVALLRDELDAQPDADVLALAESLRTTAAEPRTAPVTTPAPLAPRAPAAASASQAEPIDQPTHALQPIPPQPPLLPIWSRAQLRRAVIERVRTPLKVRRRRQFWSIMVAAGFVALFVLFAEALRPQLARSLVVLPLVDVSPDRDNRYFADGLTTELISRLRDVIDLDVKPPSSSFAFRGTNATSRQVAEQLGVRYVLEGTVRKDGEKLRISLTLIDVSTDRTLWSDDYDRALNVTEVFAMQEEVSRAVADELRLKLQGDAVASRREREPADFEAYNLYLRGREEWLRRTPQSLRRSIELFDEAIARDPAYALAHAGRADAYNLLGAHDYGVLPPELAFSESRRASARALELDPLLAEAHASLANVLMNHDRDYAGAEREFLRALQLNPGYTQARHWYSLMLAGLGRSDEAMTQIREARAAEPLSPVLASSEARHHYFRGDYARAVQGFSAVVASHPTFSTSRIGLALAHDLSGESAAAAHEYTELMPDPSSALPLVIALQGHALARAGNMVAARAHLNQLQQRGRTEYIAPEYMAIVLTGLGEHDAAIDWLEKALQRKSGSMLYLNVEPVLDPLRALPRFRKLVHAAGLPAQDH